MNNKADLSEIEIKVIQLMSEERTSKEIADSLCRGVRTVEGYRSVIREKVGAKNACGVLLYAIRNGIVKV
ncbi:MAG: hypothetical protein HUJ25_12815 [Crocinitomicaceae bacterium]|nr:hypothetical protein [Crocinitomicaceae bacterium]